MSLIETKTREPQQKKEYDGRKQDHGDAARQHHLDRYYRDGRNDPYDRRGAVKADKEHLKVELSFADDATDERFNLDSYGKTSAELEAAANEILKTVGDDADGDIEEYVARLDFEDEFHTPEQYGVKSRSDIAREMARRVQIDVAFDEDDTGDSDYHIPIRIKNRL